MTVPKIVLIVVGIVIIIIVAITAFALLSTPSANPTLSPSNTSPLASVTPGVTSSSTNSPAATSSPLISSTPGTTIQPTASTTFPAPSSTSPINTISPTITPAATPISTTPTPTVTTPTPSIPTPTITPTNPPGTVITFNFDQGTPTLTLRQNTPFDQTVAGITAHFSSPTDFTTGAFSVQTRESLASSSVVINSARFSGNFLWPSTLGRDKLQIRFSSNVVSLSLNFATSELHDPGPNSAGSPIRLTAYMNSLSTPVGTPLTATGIQPTTDIYPEGALTFSSSGQPFNLIEIDLPTTGASGFIIDSIAVTTG